MGKANKVKWELLDAVEMLNLIQTLKDIADNKFYTLLNQKDRFRRFGETFVEFFRMISLTKVQHPMIVNNNPVAGILVVTAEGSFLGEFNNKVIRRALEEKDKYPQAKFIAVGAKSVERLRQFTTDLKVFSDVEKNGLYETAVAIKDYIVGEVMNNRIGKVVVCYAWPKSFEMQRPRSLKLLPCEDLISKQAQYATVYEKAIEESDPKNIIGFLTNLWITTRIYEVLFDTTIAAAAAQANFLEDSVEKMKKQARVVRVKFRKAKKGDIDKSLRETFSARMMAMKGS